jgi:NitT/TauT family transport system substrate-binding protein
VVRTHPETGRKALFVSEHFTTRIVGIPEDESRALLAELFAHSVKPEHVYRHRWAPHDLVFWDNRSLMHLAGGTPDHLRRKLYRTTMKAMCLSNSTEDNHVQIDRRRSRLVACRRCAAQAEGRIRIAEQFGVVYLLLNVAQDQQLIEKQGKKLGVDITVERTQLSGGSAVNDALLSGAIDIAGAGVGPLLTIWDRTNGKQNVKGVASLGSFPYYLVSTNPKVKSIADLSEKDRIALPAVTVSVQSRILQYAAAKQWGERSLRVSINLRRPCRTRMPRRPSLRAARRSTATLATRRSRSRSWRQSECAHRAEFLRCAGRPEFRHGAVCNREVPQRESEDLSRLHRRAGGSRAVHRQNPEGAADTYLRISKARWTASCC